MTNPALSPEAHAEWLKSVGVVDLSEQRNLNQTAEQVAEARARLAIDPLRCPRLGFDKLHDITGPMFPEAFWVLAAFRGGGKSTVVAQQIDMWVRDQKRVFFLPLEQPARITRLLWAAVSLNYNPRYVLENDWNRLPPTAQRAVHEHLSWQQSVGREWVEFSDEPFVGVNELLEAYKQAQAFGASVVVIDHLHRMDLGAGNAWQGLVKLCQTLKECAKEFQIPVLCTAQLHRGDGDILAPFLPPKWSSVQGGEIVAQESDLCVAMYRPLIDQFTADDAKAIRMGQAKIRQFLEGTIGFHVLKHRNRGEYFGEIVKLPFKQGRIVDPETEDRIAYESRNDL